MIRQIFYLLSNNINNVLEDLAGISAIFVLMLIILHLPTVSI